uniref:Uncharacterized protein n=1 Tax=Oryza punctata TaxID=4537 RepID=A0A0E0JT04_ORYPU
MAGVRCGDGGDDRPSPPPLSPPSHDGSGNGGVGGCRGWIRLRRWRPRTDPAAVTPSAPLASLPLRI